MTTIQTKRSTTTTSVPADSTLALGELAVNITDKKVWIGGLTAAPVLLVDYALFASGGVTYFEGPGINISTEDVISLDLSTASFSSANLAGALTDKTGTGVAVFATSPTLITPNLGTPTTLVGTNITGTGSSFTAGTATNANNIAMSPDNTGSSFFVTFVTATSGNNVLRGDSGTGINGLTYVPSTATLTTGTVNAATITTATDLSITTAVAASGNDISIRPYGILSLAPNISASGGGTLTSISINNPDLGAGLVTVAGGDLYLSTKNDDIDTTQVNIIFEGATANGFETTLTVADPTADRTITLPNATGTVALTTDLSQFAATSSAQLAGVINDETGTGSLVFATSPTLVTPALGAATGTTLVLSGNLTAPNVVYDVNGLVGPIDVIAGAGIDVDVTTNNSIIITAAPNTTTQTLDFSASINKLQFAVELTNIGSPIIAEATRYQIEALVGTQAVIRRGNDAQRVVGTVESVDYYTTNPLPAGIAGYLDIVLKPPFYDEASPATTYTAEEAKAITSLFYFGEIVADTTFDTVQIVGGAGYKELLHIEETYVLKGVTGQAWVTADSFITCKILGLTSADHSPEDGIIEGVRFEINNIVAGVGFDIMGHAPEGTYGKYQIKCLGQ